MAGLFLVDQAGRLTSLSETDYDSEDLLQGLLADYPELLGGDQMGSSPRQWLFVAREAPVPDRAGSGGRWSLDHLFLDQEAIPTFVEVKRASDTRIRREVVGQMLDYAANGLRHWPVEQIQGFLASRVGDVDSALADAFGSTVEPSAYWQQLRENLGDGRVRLLFVADKIPDELLAVVEFLNRQMDHTEVLAVEIPQFTGQGLRTLAPRVLGQTQEAMQRKTGGVSASRKWDESTYFAEIERLYPDDRGAFVRAFYDWNVAQGYQIVWGTGVHNGSFQGRRTVNGKSYIPAVCFTGGTLEIELYWMSSWPPFDDLEKRREFVRRINRIPGVSIAEDDNTLVNKRPNISFDVLAQPEAFELLTDAVRWFMDQAEGATVG